MNGLRALLVVGRSGLVRRPIAQRLLGPGAFANGHATAHASSMVMRFAWGVVGTVVIFHLAAAAGVAQSSGRIAPPAQIDVNRPHTPFDCDLPIGINWYGSTKRCLQYMCGDKNVYNQWIFDQDNRRRKNPCYGQSPTDFGEEFQH